ncbi:MAG: alanine racemase [Candidatus Liptonbacteria bacterium]
MSEKKLSARNFLASETLAGKRTWIEIDKSAARHNFRVFRRLAGQRAELWPVVKSNAYGHGIFIFSKLMQEFGADGLCVDSALEAFALRRKGIKLPLLVLGPTLPILFKEALAEKVAITVPSREILLALSRSRHIPKFHLKFDTGMHRQGFLPQETNWVLKYVKKHPNLAHRLCGTYSHFAFADPAGFNHTEKQYRAFCEIRDRFAANGFGKIKYHIANTGGVLLAEKYRMDLIRPGIGMYGLYPSPALKNKYARLKLKPVLAWKTRVSEVKKIPSGERVGYDLTEKISHAGALAILPVGYWHGYPRSLSSKGKIILAGRWAKVLGRVSMDLSVVDTGGLKVRPGDTAILIGKNGRMEVSADKVAAWAGTISYEFLTRLNPLIERVIIKRQKK